MASIHQMIIQNQIIEFKLTYRHQKNLILRLRDNHILISAPYGTSYQLIQNFIINNFNKIEKAQNRYQNCKKISFTPPEWILIFNQPIKLELTNKKVRTKFLSNKIIITNVEDQEILTKKLYNFLTKEYKAWFWSRTIYWANILNVEFKDLVIKNMLSKWGVCCLEEQKITLNIKLIHYNLEVIDYVIVHELTHLFHPNHSWEFWEAIGNYLPNYLELKNNLRS